MYLLKETKVYNQSLRSSLGASNSVTDFSALSNPAGAQNISCLGLCGNDSCPKGYA